MIRIINHKKVDLTNDEYAMFESICKANDRPAFKGESLFEDHFDVNGDGIIVFVRPPHKKFSSLEVYCFLVSLMVNQHIRIMHEQTNMLVSESEKKFKELLEETQKKTDNLTKMVEEAKTKNIIKNKTKKATTKASQENKKTANKGPRDESFKIWKTKK